MTSFDLSQRVAFITGGNGGIGLGMAKGLAAAGASVAIAGRNKVKAKAALAELRGFGGEAEFIELDVLQEASCRQAVARAAERFGRLDILVNNAGTSVRKQPQELSVDDWHHGDEHESHQRVHLFAGGLSAHAARRRRQDHQYRLDDVGVRLVLCDALCGEQGRHRADGAGDGGGLGQGQYPGQYDPAGLDRYRARRARRASRSPVCTRRCWRARRRNAGAFPTILPVSPCSSLRRPRISSPARLSPWTAAIRCRPKRPARCAAESGPTRAVDRLADLAQFLPPIMTSPPCLRARLTP